MKPLPKEFQFKCDEHSLEQCKKLGINLNYYPVKNLGEYYFVQNNCILYCWDNTNTINSILISLADYIENESDIKMAENPIGELQPCDHSDLIVELTGKYVACMATDLNIHSFELDSPLVKKAINLAEETVKQLKEKKYL